MSSTSVSISFRRYESSACKILGLKRRASKVKLCAADLFSEGQLDSASVRDVPYLTWSSNFAERVIVSARLLPKLFFGKDRNVSFLLSCTMLDMFLSETFALIY